jgi:hypothetical protein
MAASANRPTQTATIHVRLRELAQLFNSMDPSPFLDRDIDADAEEFILAWARDFPADREFELVIQLATPPPPERAAETEEAVRHYFSERGANRRREFRHLMRRGRMSLLIGLVFLAACLTAGNILERHGAFAIAGILKESFIIVGWVAMWRPLEIYLYDWWPLREECHVFERLSRMRVRLVPAA